MSGDRPRDEVMIRDIMRGQNLDGRDAKGDGWSDEEIEHVVGGEGVMRGGGYVLTQAVIIKQRQQLCVDGWIWVGAVEVTAHDESVSINDVTNLREEIQELVVEFGRNGMHP